MQKSQDITSQAPKFGKTGISPFNLEHYNQRFINHQQKKVHSIDTSILQPKICSTGPMNSPRQEYEMGEILKKVNKVNLFQAEPRRKHETSEIQKRPTKLPELNDSFTYCQDRKLKYSRLRDFTELIDNKERSDYLRLSLNSSPVTPRPYGSTIATPRQQEKKNKVQEDQDDLDLSKLNSALLKETINVNEEYRVPIDRSSPSFNYKPRKVGYYHDPLNSGRIKVSTQNIINLIKRHYDSIPETTRFLQKLPRAYGEGIRFEQSNVDYEIIRSEKRKIAVLMGASPNGVPMRKCKPKEVFCLPSTPRIPNVEHILTATRKRASLKPSMRFQYKPNNAADTKRGDWRNMIEIAKEETGETIKKQARSDSLPERNNHKINKKSIHKLILKQPEKHFLDGAGFGFDDSDNDAQSIVEYIESRRRIDPNKLDFSRR